MTVILKYGMGADSTAALLRWLTDPSSRDFDLADLIVLTAQTGDEYPDTKRDVEAHVLPMLRAHGVRFVQVARAGRFEDSGIVVLDDSRSPTECRTEGAWKLSDELQGAGTIPARRGSQKLCTQKFKGWVLDRWVAANGYDAVGVRHVIGFEANEQERVVKDQGYTRNGTATEYPLVEWGWNREACLSFIRSITGITWRKSACVFCPFASLKGSGCVDRYREDPASAVKAMKLEAMSLMLNPRVGLFSGRTLRQVVERSGNDAALRGFHSWLASVQEWAVYRVRRAYTGPAKASRELTTVYRGTSGDAHAYLAGIAGGAGGTWGAAVRDTHDAGFWRFYSEERVEGAYPAREEMFVVGPAGVDDKVQRTTFDRRWEAACST